LPTPLLHLIYLLVDLNLNNLSNAVFDNHDGTTVTGL